VESNGDSHRAQLERILKSDVFRNTEVLKRLLEYLGRRALSGDARDLKEYTVGVEAFGKNADYDPKTDSSVRVQAGKLRQRLEEYYRTEGTDAPVIVELPKGHFQLQFRLRATAGPTAGSTPRRAIVPWAGIAVVWAACATVIAAARSPTVAFLARYSDPNVMALWSPFLVGSRRLVVSLGTPLFAKISGDFFRDPLLNQPKNFGSSPELASIEKILNGHAVPSFGYTGIGEASAAFELARLFIWQRRDINLIPSSALSWEDIARDDVIFVGPPKFNLAESDLPVEQDFAIRHGRLENLHPKPGEPASFTETWVPDAAQPLEGYALVARLPGLHGTGSIMLLASTSTEGARAAVEYVTRPEYAARLVRSLRKGGQSALPAYFEAVVRARFQSQTPIEIQQVTVHVLR
jgi:hypothetical protein